MANFIVYFIDSTVIDFHFVFFRSCTELSTLCIAEKLELHDTLTNRSYRSIFGFGPYFSQNSSRNLGHDSFFFLCQLTLEL